MFNSNKPDVILVFSFGNFDSPHAHPNRELKNHGIFLSGLYWIPVVMQESINLTESEWMWSSKKHSLYVIPEGKEYLSTLDYVLRFANLAEKMKWKKILVVAAAPHRKRCVKNLLKFDFTITYSDPNEICCTNKSIKWYNRESKHWQTRHPLLWWPRELLLRTIT